MKGGSRRRLRWRLPAGLSLRGAIPRSVPTADADLARELGSSVPAVADTWIADHPAENLAWDWGEGVLAFGLERAFHLSGNAAYRAYLRTYLRAHAAAGVRLRWSDDTTPALAASERVKDGDRDLAPLVAEVAHYAMSAPRSSPHGLWLHLGRTPLAGLMPDAWVNSLFHLVPTLMRYAEISGDVRYRDEGARQLSLFSAVLQEPSTGLCTHACDDGPAPRRVPPFASRAFWARGNGWMLVALVDALAHLPANHHDRAELLERALRLEAALRGVQSKDGLFHTLLLMRDCYQETAGSALILYGMAQGLRLGLFPAETRGALVRGARGLLSILRRERGRTEVTGTSLGTNPIELGYRITPTADQVSYGVGAWLLAASEIAASL